MNKKYVNGFEFVSICYPFYEKKAIKIVHNSFSLKEYQEFIFKNNIEEAEIIMPDLSIVKMCPMLRKMNIFPSCDSIEDFDFSPLYCASEIVSLHCINKYGPNNEFISPIDYSRIKGLIDLSLSVNEGALNYNQVKSLRSLRIGGFEGQNNDISDLFTSKELDTLQLTECKISSLNGIEMAPKMQCLYLYYNRSLKCINALRGVKKTLKALRIEKCPKINDFSVLSELENLELLELSGSNELPDLSFLKKMKNLKTFVFNMNVKDGDLTPCLDLSYVYSEINRKHYNLKDAYLPKGEYVRGNETIEAWRRLE